MKKYKKFSSVLAVLFCFLSPILVSADDTIVNPIKSKDITTLVKSILEGVIKIGLPIITLAIIYSGFLFVSARGNTEKISEARRTLLYTLIGAAILIGSWAIAQIITNTVTAL